MKEGNPNNMRNEWMELSRENMEKVMMMEEENKPAGLHGRLHGRLIARLCSGLLSRLQHTGENSKNI